MDRQQLMENCCNYTVSSEWNYIPEEKALSAELASVRIFDEPIMAVADAGNPEFTNLKSQEIIGKHFTLPTAWLPEAKTVLSFFFPFTKTIRESNKSDMRYPSRGWLHGRVEGQHFINSFCEFVVELLRNDGFQAIAPSIDKRFLSNTANDKWGVGKVFTSNWSERHVAYVCGLGTFGLSKGIITEKGMAGRLASIITELYLPPDHKAYREYTENCIMCGKCIKNCPAHAISLEHGKNHEVCSKFLDMTLAENSPRYGCGKCQVNVPCENRNPAKAKSAAT